MGEAHLDHPGEVSWFKGRGPVALAGTCPHECQHRDTGNLAWGPDFERYTLDVCVEVDGCAGRCRGWVSEYPPAEAKRLGKPRSQAHGFRLMADESDWMLRC